MTVFDYRMKSPKTLINIEDFRRRAKRKLPSMIWEYVDGGADDLRTVRNNSAAFSRWSVLPQVLRGAGEPDLSATLCGVQLDLPVLLAPTGFTGLSHWEGDVAAARAAERSGSRYVLSTSSSWSIEEVSDRTTEQHFFQLYPQSGGVTQELMRRAAQVGTDVLFITVDVPIVGNREGERRQGMGKPPVVTPRRMLNLLRHPQWLYAIARHQRVAGRNLVQQNSARAAIESVEMQERELMRPVFSWTDLQELRDSWGGRLIVKGILRPEDAASAVKIGVDGIVVSNHGGRQVGHAPATLDCLPAVRDAVPSGFEVLLDGGIRRGLDVVKALARGATGVMIGRPYVYGLAANGQQGVEDVLSILREDLRRNLTLLGLANLGEISKDILMRDNIQYD